VHNNPIIWSRSAYIAKYPLWVDISISMLIAECPYMDSSSDVSNEKIGGVKLS
jgi:hypothetical protein